MENIEQLFLGILLGTFIGLLQFCLLVIRRKKIQKQLNKAKADKKFWMNLVLRDKTLNK